MLPNSHLVQRTTVAGDRDRPSWKRHPDGLFRTTPYQAVAVVKISARRQQRFRGPSPSSRIGVFSRIGIDWNQWVRVKGLHYRSLL